MFPSLFPREPFVDPSTTIFQVMEFSNKTKYWIWDENMQAWFDTRTGDLVQREQHFEKKFEKTDNIDNPFPSGDPFRVKKHILYHYLQRETKEDIDLLKYVVKRYYEEINKQKQQFRGVNKNCILIWIMALTNPTRMEEFYNYFEPGWENMYKNGLRLKVCELNEELLSCVKQKIEKGYV